MAPSPKTPSPEKASPRKATSNSSGVSKSKPKTPSPRKMPDQRLLEEAQQFVHDAKGMTNNAEGQRMSTRVRTSPQRLADENVSPLPPKKPTQKKKKKTTLKKRTGKKEVQVEVKEEEPEEQGEPGEEKIHVRGIGWTYESRIPEGYYLLACGIDEQGKTRYYLREFTPSDTEDEETWLQDKQNRRENFPDVDLNPDGEESSDEDEVSDGSQDSEYEVGKKKRKKGKGKAKASPKKAAARKKETIKKPAAPRYYNGKPPADGIPVTDDDVIVVVNMKSHEIVKDWGLGADKADNKEVEDFKLIAKQIHDGPVTKQVLSGKEKDDVQRLNKIFTELAELEKEYEYATSVWVPEKKRLVDNDSAGPPSKRVKYEADPDSEDEVEVPRELEPPPPKRSYHTQADEDEAYAGEHYDDYDSLVEEFGDESREGKRFHFVHDLTDPVVLQWVVKDIYCDRHPLRGVTGAPTRMVAKIGRTSGEGIIAVLAAIVNAALRLKHFTVLQKTVSPGMRKQDPKFRKKFWAHRAMTEARLREMVAMGAWIKESWDLHHTEDMSRLDGIVERWDRKRAVYNFYIGQAAIAYGLWQKRVLHGKTGKRTKKWDREVSRGMRKWLPQPESSDDDLDA